MIKAGDLVMVVRGWPCCGYDMGIGRFREVKRVFSDVEGWCAKCKTPVSGALSAEFNDGICLVSRLKKIDPPATGEYDRVPQKLKEPA